MSPRPWQRYFKVSGIGMLACSACSFSNFRSFPGTRRYEKSPPGGLGRLNACLTNSTPSSRESSWVSLIIFTLLKRVPGGKSRLPIREPLRLLHPLPIEPGVLNRLALLSRFGIIVENAVRYMNRSISRLNR